MNKTSFIVFGCINTHIKIICDFISAFTFINDTKNNKLYKFNNINFDDIYLFLCKSTIDEFNKYKKKDYIINKDVIEYCNIYNLIKSENIFDINTNMDKIIIDKYIFSSPKKFIINIFGHGQVLYKSINSINNNRRNSLKTGLIFDDYDIGINILDLSNYIFNIILYYIYVKHTKIEIFINVFSCSSGSILRDLIQNIYKFIIDKLKIQNFLKIFDNIYETTELYNLIYFKDYLKIYGLTSSNQEIVFSQNHESIPKNLDKENIDIDFFYITNVIKNQLIEIFCNNKENLTIHKFFDNILDYLTKNYFNIIIEKLQDELTFYDDLIINEFDILKKKDLIHKKNTFINILNYLKNYYKTIGYYLITPQMIDKEQLVTNTKTSVYTELINIKNNYLKGPDVELPTIKSFFGDITEYKIKKGGKIKKSLKKLKKSFKKKKYKKNNY
jgi:hypothetical protein